MMLVSDIYAIFLDYDELISANPDMLTGIWENDIRPPAIYHTYNQHNYTKFLFPDNTNFVVVYTTLTIFVRMDDVGIYSGAVYHEERGKRVKAATRDLLQYFMTKEQNIELAKAIWNLYKFEDVPLEDVITATRAAPAPSAVPLRFGHFKMRPWKQQYVSEDRYFGA